MSLNKKDLGFLMTLILLVGGILRLLFLITPYMDSDQAINGLMARHILGGEFPFFFYGQDYCGSIEAYLVSTVFFFFGASRYTLNSAIGLESLFFIILIYFLARAVSDKRTAFLAALFASVPSYYLAFHSVLARSAYIEIPIIGTLLFIVGQKIIYQNDPKGRNFLFLGFLCGLGMWTHFLVVFYLAPLFLFLFMKDKWFWGRPVILFFFLGLILGGLPLWTHNIANPLVTWHYLMIASEGTQSALTSLGEFFLYRFPEVLGVRDNETQNFFLPFFSFPLYMGYLSFFLFLFLSYGKNLWGIVKFKINDSSGLDLLLFYLLCFPFIFAFSGFAIGHTSRYLQPLFSALPILLAVFIFKIRSYSVVLATLFCLAIFFSNIYGTLVKLPLISPSQLKQFRDARENDRNLFAFLKEKKITRLYCLDYWNAVRLTFDAREEILFASPSVDRYPKYTEWIDRIPNPAFFFPGDNKDFEETLKGIGGTYQKTQVFGYSIYHDFSPPPFGFIELDSTPHKVAFGANPIEGIRIFDRDLTSGWTSQTPQKPGLNLQIDLGQVVPDLGRITLLAGKTGGGPRGLRLEISADGRNWEKVREVNGLWGDLFWSGPHPFYRPGSDRVDLTFSPQSGRFLRLTLLGSDPIYYWSVAECFIYHAQPKKQQLLVDLNPLIFYLRRLNSFNIFASPWTQSQLPLEWRAKQKALHKEKEGLVRTISNPVIVVEKENAPALSHFLKNNLNKSYQKQEIDGQIIYFFNQASERYRPISSTAWRFQTNYNPQKAHLAADGKLFTRWTTERPQIPGAFFQIDLGKMEKVARIRFLTGESVDDYPRGYSIRYSADGQTWTAFNAMMSPVSLHWTGETLLKDGRELDFTFPDTSMRYIQIINQGEDEVYYWSIHEVEIFERQKN